MLRLATVASSASFRNPTSRRRLIASSGAAVTFTTLAASVYSQTKTITDNEGGTAVSPALRSYRPPTIADLTLIKPTFEASIRALRLIRTAALMVVDYELYKYDDVFSYVRELTASEGGGDNKRIEERKQWEREVKRLTEELEQAQVSYTSGPDEDYGGEEQERGEGGQSWREQSVKRKKEAVHRAAERLGEAEETLAQIGDRRSETHRHAAGRLLRLCRENGGVYIKVGQHLANLDYLIPQEYIEVLSSLFDDAPLTDFSDVCAVIEEELGQHPSDLFDTFEEIPIASASLAQVHVAYEKETGKKLAVKVQHRGLRETSAGDLFALTLVVKTVEALFDEFTWGWIVDEITPQLPRELDFHNEGRNSEMAAANIRKAGIRNCVVPKVNWNQTTRRVLCMDFEEGFRATDLDAIDKAGLKKRDVAKLISSVFNSQVFESGFIHCDPHPANVLLRERDGKPEMVLVDHGLYKKIDDDFRIRYARLWRALMMADITGIKQSCHTLGIDEMYPLLAAMLTSRPFDEIIERSKTGAFELDSKRGNASDKAMLRGYAQRYIKDIFDMLDSVPRQMLLLFKMNDCLRHIDYALGSPTNTLTVAGKFAACAVYNHEAWDSKSPVSLLNIWLEYARVLVRIQAHDILLWFRDQYSSLRVL